MGCRGRDGQHPGRVGVREGFVQEAARLFGNHVGRVFPGVADGFRAVAGHLRVVVTVGVGVQQKVGAVEPLGKRLVVVGHAMGVPQLARVVGVVSGLLHPDWQVVVVPPGFDYSGVTTVRRVHIGDVGVMRHAASPDVGTRWTA